MAVVTTYNRTVLVSNGRANGYEPTEQFTPDVAAAPDGSFINVYGNTFAEPLPVGTYISSNLETAPTNNFAVYQDTAENVNMIGAPTIARLANGTYVVAWDEGGDGGANDVRGRIVSATGGGIGNEFSLSGFSSDTAPDVVGLTNGNFVVVVNSSITAYHQLFSPTGAPVNGQANAESLNGTSTDVHVAALADGGYVVTFTNVEASRNSGQPQIYGRVFNADGTPRAAEFVIGEFGDNTQSAVVGLPNGNWVVVYADTGWLGGGGLTLQVYTPNGVNVTAGGSFQRVDTNGSTVDTDPDITVLENGFIVVSWTDPAASGNIIGRLYDQAGNAVQVAGGDTFIITGSATADIKSSISAMFGGRFVAVWQDSLGDSSGGRISYGVSEITRTSTSDGAGDTIVGDALNDTMIGAGGNDILVGLGGNDSFDTGAGNDAVDGGAGSDGVAFANARNQFFIRSFESGGTIFTYVNDNTGALGLDTLVRVEALAFTSGSFGIVGVQQNRVANFDAASFDDVVFRNVNTGQVISANFNGTNTALGFDNLLGALPAGWRPVGSGDVTNDGRAELFVQDTNTGSVYSVNLAGGSPVWTAATTSLTSDYKVVGLGDFTLDGIVDFVIRSDTTGMVLFGELDNGGGFAGWANVANLGLGWRVVGVGDVDRDGFSDVVVQESASGVTYYANIDNGVFAGWGSVSGAIGFDWVGKDVGDVNGDGYFDVIFRNQVTGQIWYQNMLGGAGSGFGVVTNGVGTGWDVRGMGDPDNDGYADVIIQNLNDGTTYYADMNNGVLAGFGTASGPLGLDWIVVGGG